MLNGKYVSVKDLARELRVSPKTIFREVHRGKLQPKRIGNKYVFEKTEIDDYLGETDWNGKIRQFIMQHKNEMIEMLQKMVAVPSESETGGEEKLAKFLQQAMEKLGLNARLVGQGESVALRYSYGYQDKGVLWDCPLDTTPAGDINRWKYPPYGGFIDGGKMYGRGAADAKAGIAAMIYAAVALKKMVDPEKIRVELVFDGGEQNGAYLGMKNVLKQGLPVEFGVVGYAGDWQKFAIGARGYHRYKLISYGEAVHTGSGSKKGVNAISNMARLILELEKINFPKKFEKYFPFGCRMTLAQIAGGRAINIVPDECEAYLDVRVVPGVGKTWVDEMLKSLISKLSKQNTELKIDFGYLLGQEAYVVDDSKLPVKSFKNSILEVLKLRPLLLANGPSHIGNLLNQYKIPVVVWGPKGGNIHSYDEYVEIDSIAKTCELYIRSVLNHFKLVD